LNRNIIVQHKIFKRNRNQHIIANKNPSKKGKIVLKLGEQTKMEYLHASLILHSTGKKITEKAVSEILTAAGVVPDKNRIKGLIASLVDVNIEDALKSAASMPTVAAAPVAAAATEEEESGLSSLFG